jgi:hypothetical protein
MEQILGVLVINKNPWKDCRKRRFHIVSALIIPLQNGNQCIRHLHKRVLSLQSFSLAFCWQQLKNDYLSIVHIGSNTSATQGVVEVMRFY